MTEQSDPNPIGASRPQTDIEQIVQALAQGRNKHVRKFLARLRIDPALAASLILTTVTDLVCFFAFLGLATVLLLQ